MSRHSGTFDHHVACNLPSIIQEELHTSLELKASQSNRMLLLIVNEQTCDSDTQQVKLLGEDHMNN